MVLRSNASRPKQTDLHSSYKKAWGTPAAGGGNSAGKIFLLSSVAEGSDGIWVLVGRHCLPLLLDGLCVSDFPPRAANPTQSIPDPTRSSPAQAYSRVSCLFYFVLFHPALLCSIIPPYSTLARYSTSFIYYVHFPNLRMQQRLITNNQPTDQQPSE